MTDTRVLARNSEAPPDAREVLAGANLSEFSRLVEKRVGLKALVKQAEEELKALDGEITALMTEAGAPKLQYGESLVSLCQGHRHSLSKEKLFEAGVSSSVIAQCTVSTTYSYLLVSTKGNETSRH